MFLLIVTLLTSPLPSVLADQGTNPVRDDRADVVCSWYDPYARRCRDSDVEYLGAWDPREDPSEWPHSYYPSPPAWGAFALERVAPDRSGIP